MADELGALDQQFAGLGEAARHFGEALCPPGDLECAAKVGAGYERAIEERFGVLGSNPPPPVRWTEEIATGNGQRVGELRNVDGILSLCLDHPTAGNPKCAVLGSGGEDAASAALNALYLLGLNHRRV